ncbi:hypothetical protein PZH36_02835 [Ruminococcus bromii]|uniref:hypothetical protein n=1 Tax=Ruminococcus bromii TaxID=40518 RepID=UPI00292F67FB|nr:hypothetical protein [Ruminococcus bromii]MDE8726067.1 hypothetical protein [Ruminococcus bromii]
MNYQKEVSNLRTKYFVNYEALVLNLPLRTDLELLDHKFLVNSLSSEDEKRLLVFDKDTLKFNYLFMSCCFSYSTDQISYVTIQNNRPMEFLGDEKYKDDLRNMFAKTTLDRIESLEHGFGHKKRAPIHPQCGANRRSMYITIFNFICYNCMVFKTSAFFD